MRRVAAAIALLAATGIASAGMMLEASIGGQPLQYLKDGRVHGCGVRFIGLVQSPNSTGTEGFDASINVYGSGLGLVKGGGFFVTAEDLAHRQTGKRRPRPEALWIRAANVRATQPNSGGLLSATDPPEAVMYGASDLEGLIQLFNVVLDRKPLQVGIKFPSEPVERVYHGIATLSDAEIAQVRSCFAEMLQEDESPGSK